MLGIGQFAQLAKVSVRTLRYYGDHGLLMPAHVDPDSGYRSYEASQLADLNRILVMKDLGLSLDEIHSFVAHDISVAELISLAKERQVEAQEQIELEQQRLHRVAIRIDYLSKLEENTMTITSSAIVIKELDPMRLATASEIVPGFDANLADVFGRLYPLIFSELARLGVHTALPTVALYEEHPDGIEVIAAAQIPADSEFTSELLERRDLPKVERAATFVHTGDMITVGASHEALLEWVVAADEAPLGYTREVYLECDGPQETWVTELQVVLAEGS